METQVKVWDVGTIYYYSDRDPVTVVEVKGKKVWVKINESKNISKEERQNDWEILPTFKSEKVIYFSLRDNWRFIPVGEDKNSCSSSLVIWRQYRYYDYWF